MIVLIIKFGDHVKPSNTIRDSEQFLVNTNREKTTHKVWLHKTDFSTSIIVENQVGISAYIIIESNHYHRVLKKSSRQSLEYVDYGLWIILCLPRAEQPIKLLKFKNVLFRHHILYNV